MVNTEFKLVLWALRKGIKQNHQKHQYQPVAHCNIDLRKRPSQRANKPKLVPVLGKFNRF